MHGFHREHQYLPTTRLEKHRAARLVAGATLCFSLCLTSGCAMIRSAKDGVHKATCTHASPSCNCSCGECSSHARLANEALHNQVIQPAPAPNQTHIAVPAMPTGQPRGFSDVKPQSLSYNGVPGTWTPSQNSRSDAEFTDPALAIPNDATAEWQIRDTDNANQIWIPSTPAQRSTMSSDRQKYLPNCAPQATTESNEMKEYRTQVLILSQQISQMKTEQEAIRSSQETLQQSHEREFQELKLQQTTAARDAGLERIRELEYQLRTERERELDTIDTISQLLESATQTPIAAPRSAPSNPALRQVPPPPAQARQTQPQTSQILPAVE